MKRWLAAMALTLGLGGCSATGVLGTLTASPGVRTAADEAYAPGPRHGVDVYAPKGTVKAVVVFFYGGGWDSGARNDYRFVGQALADKGYLTFVPDYRVYPEVRYPDFLRDCAEATRWARDHAAAYGGDPRTLFLMGHSAGAYNAAMLTLDPRWLTAVGMDPRRDVRGTVGLAGPYDFLPLKSAELKTIFGPEDQRPATQPIAYVTGDAPPMLLMAGRNDTVVDPGNSERLAARIRQRGGDVQVVMFDKLSHPLIVGALAGPLTFLAPVKALTAEFIDAHTPRPGA